MPFLPTKRKLYLTRVHFPRTAFGLNTGKLFYLLRKIPVEVHKIPMLRCVYISTVGKIVYESYYIETFQQTV
jgi:hypothetical protein